MAQTECSAAIFGIEGLRLNAEEKAFFSDINPYGYILFTRNCEHPEQIRALIDELKNLQGSDWLPVLIDQEGGRVARLKPPYWRASPPAGRLASLASQDIEKARGAVYLNARIIAHELDMLGINVNCAPVADILIEGAHAIVGDRAYGKDPARVAALARAMAEGLMDGGVLPVLKHIPGHGRAHVDSHEALPVVDASLELLRSSDFVPFKELAGLPMAMTAHVLYTAIDKENLATVSPSVIRLIREEIGFSGLLMSDDLSMRAMSGDMAERTRGALNAGCDVVLHCNGKMEEMQAIAGALTLMRPESIVRANEAYETLAEVERINREAFDIVEADAELNSLLQAA